MTQPTLDTNVGKYVRFAVSLLDSGADENTPLNHLNDALKFEYGDIGAHSAGDELMNAVSRRFGIAFNETDREKISTVRDLISVSEEKLEQLPVMPAVGHNANMLHAPSLKL